MPTAKTPLVNSEIYHISDRAVGDSVIFKDEDDYYRGIFSLYEFNNDELVDIWLRRKQRKAEKIKEKSFASSGGGSDPPINLLCGYGETADAPEVVSPKPCRRICSITKEDERR